MKIGEIVPNNLFPDGFQISSFNVSECGSNSTIDCITVDDLNEYAKWLIKQQSYEVAVRRILEFNRIHKEEKQ